MKKKLTALFAIVLVISLLTTIFSACDEMFTKNAEREQAQRVAIVRYVGEYSGIEQVGYITKGELRVSFNNYAYTYVYYYSMTYEAAADYILSSLAARELMVLWARETIAYQRYLEDGTWTLNPATSDISLFLNNAEINHAIELTNKDMLTGVKDKIEEFKEEATRESSSTTDEEEEDEVPETPYPTSARATLPEVEEDDDYDPEVDIAAEDIALKFFDTDYIAMIKANPADYLDKETDVTYLDRAIAAVKNNMKDSFRSYDYYLNSQYKTVLLARLERSLKSGVNNPTDGDILSAYNRLVNTNIETFTKDSSGYSSALTSALTTTLFTPEKYATQNNTYGFSLNILLKFSADQLQEYKTEVYKGTHSTDTLNAIRSAIAKDVMVYVSNPKYDADYVCEEHDKACSLKNCNIMTCDNHPCIHDADDAVVDPNMENTVDENGNSLVYKYNEILYLVKTDNGDGTFSYEVKFNVGQCAEMPYLQEAWPAFTMTDDDGNVRVGIVNQIYATLQFVDSEYQAGNMTFSESVYWKQQLATYWTYIVGDDSGTTSTDSNNSGLGYLVTPETETSSYITEFTTLTRALIKQGAGTYSIDGTMDEDMFFTVGSSLTDTAQAVNSNDYAGIFIEFITYVAYDEAAYTKYTGNTLSGGSLPYDYILTYGKTASKNVTVGSSLTDSLFEGSKKTVYDYKINTFGDANEKGITTYKKIYKDLYKSLD